MEITVENLAKDSGCTIDYVKRLSERFPKGIPPWLLHTSSDVYDDEDSYRAPAEQEPTETRPWML